MRSSSAFAIAFLVAVACAGCSPPQAPDTDKPPEPQATQLRDAMEAPKARAEAGVDAVEAAQERERAAIEADGG